MKIDDESNPSSDPGGKIVRARGSINLPMGHQNLEGGVNFAQLLTVLRRRTPVILGITAITVVLVYGWVSRQPKVYQANFELWVQKDSVESEVASSATQGVKATKSESLSLGNNTTLLNLLSSPKLLLPVIEQLRLQYPDINYKSLVEALTLENPKDTDILRVSYTDIDQGKVKLVLHTIAQAYLKYSLESRQKDIIQGIRFLDQQLPLLRQRVDHLQRKLQNLRQEYNLSDPSFQSQQITSQTDGVKKSQYENDIALKEAKANFSDLQRQSLLKPGVPLASTALSQNQNYQKIRAQIQELDSQISRESTLYSSDHPGLQALRDQREKLIPLLNQEINQVLDELSSQIRGLEVRDRALTQAEHQLNSNLKQMAVRTREYNDLQLELQIATNNLTQFLSKREALSIEAAQKEVPWILTTPPNNVIVVSASKIRSLLLGAIMGLLLGGGLALLIDKIKNVFYTPEEVKAETNLPFLGIIPFTPEPDNCNSLKHLVPSTILESFRSLYTSICLFNIDTPIRSLTISSVCPNDGKTTVAINLARVAASMGHRVLLVDADLRKPDIHKRLNLSNEKGLSDLMASNIHYRQAIQQISEESFLYVLTPGQLPPDPVSLLSSERMAELMQQFENAFDLVIYDTPPTCDLADASLLATKTDGMALVIGLGNTDRSAFISTLESLRLSPILVAGLIANGWKDAPRKYQQYYKPQRQPKSTLAKV